MQQAQIAHMRLGQFPRPAVGGNRTHPEHLRKRLAATVIFGQDELHVHTDHYRTPNAFLQVRAQNHLRCRLQYTILEFMNTTFAPAPIMQYRARHGRHRVYLSRSDALAYDAGFELYPAVLTDSDHTPFRDGWLDAQDEAFDQLSTAPARVLHWD